MFLNLFVIVNLINLAQLTTDCNNALCPEAPRMYTDLGCTPLREPGSCCAYRYNCSTPPTDFCRFHNQLYSLGDKIPVDKAPPCTSGCVCSKKIESMGFVCPVIDCGEFMPFSIKKCVLQKDLHSCCTNNIICDSNKIAQLPSCYYDGVQYRSGEVFFPSSEPCYRCICNSDFSNATTPSRNTNCERVNCLVEIHNSDKIQKGCVPIYYPDAKICCPINYRCPSGTDFVVPSNSSDESTIGNTYRSIEDSQCSFGKLTLDVDESLNVIDKSIECTCRIPPLIECIKSKIQFKK